MFVLSYIIFFFNLYIEISVELTIAQFICHEQRLIDERVERVR